jgi:hypothetical protein
MQKCLRTCENICAVFCENRAKYFAVKIPSAGNFSLEKAGTIVAIEFCTNPLAPNEISGFMSGFVFKPRHSPKLRGLELKAAEYRETSSLLRRPNRT